MLDCRVVSLLAMTIGVGPDLGHDLQDEQDCWMRIYHLAIPHGLKLILQYRINLINLVNPV